MVSFPKIKKKKKIICDHVCNLEAGEIFFNKTVKIKSKNIGKLTRLKHKTSEK